MTRFADKQIIKLQETPDEIPEGGTPHTVSVLMHDKLVDAGKPGDRVEVRICLCLLISTINLGTWFLSIQIFNLPFLFLLQITGIYRAMSIRVGPTQRTVKSIFKVKHTELYCILMFVFLLSTNGILPCCEVLSDGIPSFSDIIQTYIDCLHIKKTDKSRLHVEDTMDIDNSDANKSTEEDFLNDKVTLCTYTFLQ